LLSEVAILQKLTPNHPKPLLPFIEKIRNFAVLKNLMAENIVSV